MMLTRPYPFEIDCAECRLPGNEKVHFYMVLPLYESEMNFKLEHDAESLEELFSEDFDWVVDIHRIPVI